MTNLAAAKPGSARLFVHSNGRPWAKSEQQRPLATACIAARIDPPVNFHGLRHTYASRLAMRNVPLAVIAVQFGHSDTRMVEKHYGHLSPGSRRVRDARDRGALERDANCVSTGAFPPGAVNWPSWSGLPSFATVSST